MEPDLPWWRCFFGTLQIILDKGQDADWFSAIWLRWFTVISGLCFIGFIVRELTAKNPLVDLSIFKNRNFAVSCGLFGLFGFALYGLITLQPLFVQSLLGYSALLMPGFQSARAESARLSRCFLPRPEGRVDSRLLV